MATDSTKLQGELHDQLEAQDLDVERLLSGLLRTLLDEQRQSGSSSAVKGTADAIEDKKRSSS